MGVSGSDIWDRNLWGSCDQGYNEVSGVWGVNSCVGVFWGDAE